MTLSQRFQTILTERHIKQVDFAAALGISANYVNQLVNGKKDAISLPLARLIEETYGYSAHWIMTGEGETGADPSPSAAKIGLIKKIQNMPDDEIIALLAFANSLDSVKKAFGLASKNESLLPQETAPPEM